MEKTSQLSINDLGDVPSIVKRYGTLLCHMGSPEKVELKINEKKDKRPRLRLIPGGYPYKISLGSMDIVASTEESPPFPVEAVAVEEDTYLVLSAGSEVRDPNEPLVRVMTRVIETRPEKPGSVLVKGKSPLRLLAIVHDLNQDPSWREEWIVSAIDGIFQKAESLKLSSIALPFLGTNHGSLEKQRFVELLQSALKRILANHLKRLWLVVPAGTSSKIFETL